MIATPDRFETASRERKFIKPNSVSACLGRRASIVTAAGVYAKI
jgi:hypothetical protein